MKTWISLVCLLGHILAQAQSNGTLSGNVTDAKTGEPLIGATVRLEGTDLGSITDINGRYLIQEIPPATYNVVSSFVGYENLAKYNVVIRSEGNIDVNFGLNENVSELEAVVVTTNPFQKEEITPLSIQKLSQEEVAAYPGGNNDIAKVVQSFPGVSGSVGGFRNDVIIRGGAPNENVYYLDGIEIPTINHFSTQGSAGGPVGLLNVSFFEGVTLSASSFGAQYDNVLSGVLQFDQRNGNARDYIGNIRISSSEAAITTEGPLFKGDKDESKTTFIASARRSYLQLLFQVIGLPFLPDYWDFQYKINHKINDYNDIYFTGVGSIDDLSINELDEFDAEQQAIQDQIPVIQQMSNTTGIGWKKRFKDNTGFMTTTVSYNFLENSFFQYEDNVNEQGLYLQNDATEEELRTRYNLTKFFGDWTTSYGLVIINGNYNTETADLVNNRNFSTDLNLWRYGIYGQVSNKFFKERLGLSLGIRADGNNFTDSGNDLSRTISPRASLSYTLTQDGNLTFNSSVGRYYKILPYTTLGFRNNAGNYPNRDAEYIQSDHLVGGLEYLLTKSARISVEGFYKKYSNYPVSIQDQVSLANKGGGFEVFGSEPITSNGLGRTYGLELLFQQKFTGNFYSIASFTFYRSEFTGPDQDEYLPAVWDNGLLISLLGGYKFGNNWEISSRYRLLGRAPYAPVDQSATLENYPAVIRDFTQLGTVELDPFSQLDVRIDKKWSFSAWSLDLFLDVQNVTATSNPSEPQFGLERLENGQVVMPENLVRINAAADGSVLPSLGVVVNF